MNEFEHLPEVPGGGVLGHVNAFGADRMGFLRRIADVGPLARARFLHRSVLFVNGAGIAHTVLVERAKSFEKSPGLRIALHELAGEGLFTSEGELWRRQRKLMSPLFHHQALAAYGKVMNQVTRDVLDRVQDGSTIDLAREMTHITMGVVAATLFGAETFDKADELGEALTVALQWVDRQLASPMLTLQLTLLEAAEQLPDFRIEKLKEIRQTLEAALETPVLLPGRRDEKLMAAVRTIDGTIHAMIDERRAHPQQRVDLLTKLLLARDVDAGGEGMSDKQLRDEANTLFVAGHETTANALSWAFYLLAKHPEALAKAQAEADAFDFDGPSDPATFTEGKLTYCTWIIKEALRLYPPVVVLPRRALEPFEIDGHRYPAKTIVFVNVHGIHRSPEIWGDPDNFRPERFSPTEEAKRPRSSYIPFGDGPRVCIGMHFALMEGPIVLATLLRRARFEIDGKREIEADAVATLRPKGGVPALVKKRAATPAPTPGA